MGVFIHRGEHAALEHILHYAHGLEAYRFAAGVRARDHQYAALPGEHYVERHNLLPLFAQ